MSTNLYRLPDGRTFRLPSAGKPYVVILEPTDTAPVHIEARSGDSAVAFRKAHAAVRRMGLSRAVYVVNRFLGTVVRVTVGVTPYSGHAIPEPRP